jgi:cytochrome P450
MVSNPDDVRAVFTAPPDVLLSGHANRTFKPFLGEHSLFVMDGAPHRRHRRLLSPPFRGERMRAYGQVMRELTFESVEGWPQGKPFRLLDPMTHVTLHVIFHAVFGMTDPARIDRLAGLLEALSKRASPLLVFVPSLQRDLGRWSPWGRFLAAQERVHELLQEEITRARRDHAVGEQGRQDILAKLIEQGEAAEDPLEDDELRDELLTLLGAGHETTASALAWTAQWLLGTEGAMERVRTELTEVVGAGPLEPKHVPDLHYLRAAVHETLRLSPPIPIAVRFASEDLELNGRRVPKGTTVCPCAYLAQRNPEIYKDPTRFNPDRFLERRPGPFEFFPFGGGNRLCIGMPFAVYETTVILAAIFVRTELTLCKPASDRARRKGILLNPWHGTPVIMTRRGRSPG